jgi:hypothetical protein
MHVSFRHDSAVVGVMKLKEKTKKLEKRKGQDKEDREKKR